MQHSPTLAKHVASQAFDLATAMVWSAAHRQDGISLRVATDHETFPEVIEISPPATAEPWWCIWQDASGRYVVDNWHTWERSRLFAGMADALDFIARKIETVRHAQWHPGLPKASASAGMAAYSRQ